METTPKDIWGKAEETNQQRLAASEPGDEIVISRLDENKKQVKQTFVNITKNYFKEVQVLCGPHEEQKQIKAVGKILHDEDLLAKMKESKENLVYWHRRVFTKEEAENLDNGFTIKNYDAIKKEYIPRKMIEDMKLASASLLLSATPCSEINYYKYRNGNINGIDSYVCVDSCEFMKLKKRKNAESTREVSVIPDKKYTVWEIVNTLPKNATQLSPLKDINIRCKWNKFNKSELESLLEGKALNDEEIEKRRLMYINSKHVFVEKNPEEKQFTEYWIDKKTNDVVLTRDRTLSDEKIAKCEKNNQIVKEDAIPKKEKPVEKVKGIAPRAASKGMEM